MKHVPWFVVLGGIVVAVPILLAKASVDPNRDGCVDLVDYAVMQRDFTGPGCPTREIRSFYGAGEGAVAVIPIVPGENGFIVTDILLRTDASGTVIVRLEEEVGGAREVKLRARVLNQLELHLNTGIPFQSGSSVIVSGMDLSDVTVTGYTY
jgi:hypothetical protein